GVATADTPDGKPAAAPHAVAPHGLKRIAGAGGVETTPRPEQRAECPLVEPDQPLDDEAHRVATCFQSESRLRRSSRAGASLMRARAATTQSTAGNACCARRKDSLTMRRTRLRATALPAVRTATASPRRGAPRSFGRKVMLKKLSAMRFPPPWTFSKSDFRRKRR